MGSVLGTILDPAADKALMTTMAVTLSMKGLLPCKCCLLVEPACSLRQKRTLTDSTTGHHHTGT